MSETSDATAGLFESLRRRGHDPVLREAQGTLRFELAQNGETERWTVAVDRGDVSVTHANRKADCTVRAHKDVFDRIARGELNPLAAVLRGAVVVDGDLELLWRFQRIIPGPPRRP